MCATDSIRPMFRVLGIYNFVIHKEKHKDAGMEERKQDRKKVAQKEEE